MSDGGPGDASGAGLLGLANGYRAAQLGAWIHWAFKSVRAVCRWSLPGAVEHQSAFENVLNGSKKLDPYGMRLAMNFIA